MGMARGRLQPPGRVRTIRGMDVQAEGDVVGARPISDELLWHRSVSGDSGAFGRLFDRHRGRVFRHAQRLAETPADAEDIVAATFLELWRRRVDVRLVDGSVLPWLLVTATNVGRNVRRGTRRYRELLARLPREHTAPDVADLIMETSALAVDVQLRAALRALSRTDLRLFVLIAVEDYPLDVAAVLLGLTPSAAKSRFHRARARVRERLDRHPPHNFSDHGGPR
jgi:RNA polymerase sigma factor (sigma-70 family)